MALGCGLSSVKGNRGENNENEPLVHQKQIKKKYVQPTSIPDRMYYYYIL
jgi:hypothetical protein